MKMYVFCNTYLSPIQKGIQGCHAVTRVGCDCRLNLGDEYDLWADDFETLVFLNGGGQGDLQDLKGFLNNPDNKNYYAGFEEDYDSLNGCLTAVALLIPSTIYLVLDQYRAEPYRSRDSVFQEHKLNQFEINLVKKLATYRLAN